MSNEQSQNGNGEEFQPRTAPGGDKSDSVSLREEIVKKSHQLMYQDKITAIAEVVHLSVKNRNLQKEKDWTQQILKTEMEEKQMLQKTLLSQQQCHSAVQDLEQQRNSMASTLNNEYKSITMQLKTFEKIRSHLKTEVGTVRLSLDKLSARIFQLEEKANKQAREYKTLVSRWNTTQSELKERIEQLQGQIESQRAAQTEASAKYESAMKEREAEFQSIGDELARTLEERNRDKLTIDEQKEALGKFESENRQLSQLLEQCKLESEQTLANLRQQLTVNEQEMAKKMEEQLVASEKNVALLNDKVNQAEAGKQHLVEELADSHAQNARLDEEMKNLKEHIDHLMELLKTHNADQAPRTDAVPTMVAPKKKNRFLIDNQQRASASVRPPAGAGNSGNTTPESFDLQCIESFHHDNEMSLLLSSPSKCFIGRTRNHR